MKIDRQGGIPGPLAQIRLNYRVQLPAEVLWGSCLHMPFEATGGDASLSGSSYALWDPAF